MQHRKQRWDVNVIVHTVPVDHLRTGQPVTTLCGEHMVVGHDAVVRDPHDATPAIRCPVCEAVKILRDLQPKLEQGRLF